MLQRAADDGDGLVDFGVFDVQGRHQAHGGSVDFDEDQAVGAGLRDDVIGGLGGVELDAVEQADAADVGDLAGVAEGFKSGPHALAFGNDGVEESEALDGFDDDLAPEVGAAR